MPRTKFYLFLFLFLFPLLMQAQLPMPEPPPRDVMMTAIRIANENYQSAREFKSQKFNSIKGRFDKKENRFIPADRSYITQKATGDFFIISRKGKFGIADTTGRLLRDIDQEVKMISGTRFGILHFQPGDNYTNREWVKMMSMNSLPLPPQSGTCLIVDSTGQLLVPFEVFDQFTAYDAHHYWYFMDGVPDYRPFKSPPLPGYFPLQSWPAGNGVLVINRDARSIIPYGKYFSIGPFYGNLAVVCDSTGCGYVDTAGREIFPCDFEGAAAFSEGRAMVTKNGNVGFLDEKGNMAVPAIFAYANGFENNSARVAFGDSSRAYQWMSGRIDTSGRVVEALCFSEYVHGSYDYEQNYWASDRVKENTSDSFPVARIPGYDITQPITQKRRMVLKNGKWGFLDEHGKEIIPCIYDFASFFYEGLACVKKGRYWGAIDLSGKTVIPFRYSKLLDFRRGTSVATAGGNEVSLIDKKGNNLIAPLKFSSIQKMKSGFIRVAANGSPSRYGLYTGTGKELAAAEYGQVYDVVGKISVLLNYQNGKSGWVDTLGRKNFSYDGIDQFHDGMALVRQNKLCGFIDTNGIELIPCKYEQATGFSRGMAVFKRGDKFGAIDKKGKECIQPLYKRVQFDDKGWAIVQGDAGWGAVDANGKEILPCKYDRVGSAGEGMIYFQKNYLFGFTDKEGKVLIEPVYGRTPWFVNGKAAVVKNGKNVVVDRMRVEE